MSEIKIVKKIINVNVEDKIYPVRKPTAKEISDFAKKEDSSIDATIAFVDLLGLPSEVSWSIDADSLNEIVKAIMPNVEKKS